MLQSPKRRQGSVVDRLLALAFVGGFLYLLYLAMTGRIDDQVRALARAIAGLFGR
jgi:hypothetical protein